MWTAKLSFDGKKALIGSRTFKYKINFLGFPLSYVYQKKHIVVNITGILFGEEKNKKAFIQDLKKSPRLINLELNGDFFIGIIREPIFAKTIYNKDIIYLTPALIDENGIETANVASFNKKQLIKGITTIKRWYKTKIYYIKQRRVKNISIIREHPELTDKQKQAMNLAIKHGYYNYPKKIKLEKLAEIMKISYSTYQAHLRKAEKKLLPFFFESSK